MDAKEREWGRVVILNFEFWILNEEEFEEAACSMSLITNHQ
jgi:hypothetical protein